MSHRVHVAQVLYETQAIKVRERATVLFVPRLAAVGGCNDHSSLTDRPSERACLVEPHVPQSICGETGLALPDLSAVCRRQNHTVFTSGPTALFIHKEHGAQRLARSACLTIPR